MRAWIALLLALPLASVGRLCTLAGHNAQPLFNTAPPSPTVTQCYGRASADKPFAPYKPCPTSPLGHYKDIKFSSIDAIPGLKGSPWDKPTATIVYPQEALSGTKFPVLIWGHGTGIGSIAPMTNLSYIVAMSTVASQGFIIVGPDTCRYLECASLFHEDMLQTLKACSANRTLHPALHHADFDRVGVFGHSMGAMGAMVAAGGGVGNNTHPSDYNITAAVAMHTCWDPGEAAKNVKVPIMFTAGTADHICPDGCSELFYDAVPDTVDKILFDVRNASHMACSGIGDNSEVPAVALFLACYVKGERCEEIHGRGDGICGQIIQDKLSDCRVHVATKGSSM